MILKTVRMQKIICVITVLIILGISSTESKGLDISGILTWADFKVAYDKTYASLVEEAIHQSNFMINRLLVIEHNLLFHSGQTSYTKKLNKFADIDAVTFRQRNGFKIPSTEAISNIIVTGSSNVNRSLPSSFDWKTSNKVSPVKDQGECGCCWAFSTTGALESQILINDKPFQTLSEQQLVSCDTGGNDAGCGGGMYLSAWDYIIKDSKGLMSESEYPYTSGDGSTTDCLFNSNSIVQTMKSYELVGTDEASMKSAIVQHGPLSVGVDASDWQFVSGNDIYSCSVTPTLDHAVLVVGYGSDDAGAKYWIVKNSWSSDWGDEGFLKLARGDGDCGITQYPAFPII